MSPSWDAQLARDIVDRLAAEPGALLPILHELQAAFGCVPDPAIPLVAAALNLSRAEVHGVVTFYRDFRHAPAGRHVLKLCRAEACQSVGGDAVAQALLARLGVAWRQTTPDGRLTVEPVYCLGLCACAPAALLDDVPLGLLDEARLDAVLP